MEEIFSLVFYPLKEDVSSSIEIVFDDEMQRFFVAMLITIQLGDF